MSLLSTFIQTQLLKGLEEEYQAHAPEIQATILNEIGNFTLQAIAWVNDKVEQKSKTTSTEQ